MTTQIKNISERKAAKKGRQHLKTVALRAYSGQKKQYIKDEQIANLLPMVPGIVRRVITYLKPPLTFEDLVSAGTVGLVKAAKDYDPSKLAGFKTYAYIRIKGAILDELREWSFVSANINKQIQAAQQLSREITEQTGLVPTNAELAQKLGITIDKLNKLFENARAQHFVSIDGLQEKAYYLGDILESTNTVTPDRQVEHSELIEQLTKAIQQLPEKQKQVILLYYQQHLTMKQTAEVFNITESRVSQLHASALFNLSVKLGQWKDGRK